jgi:hypothetical protein
MSLVNTLAQEFRVASPNFDKFEFRIRRAGVLDTFLRQTNSNASFITPELAQRAFNSIGHTLKIPVIDYKDVTIRTTRPVTIAADENTSDFYTVSFSTLAYGFKMYPSLYHNNDIGYQKDFNKKFEAMLVKMIATLEGQGVTALDAAKTQVINQISGGHTFASDVLSETGTGDLNSSYILHDLEPIMEGNDYLSMGMDVVGNHQLHGILNRMEGFGEFNQEDKTLSFENKSFAFSRNITNAALKDATGYAISDGQLGVLTRVERDSLYGTTSRTGHEWDTIVMPGLGLEIGTYYYEEVVDGSTVAGAASADMTRTKAEVFDFAFDIAFVTAYNSDLTTIPSGIVKFDIATA